MDVLEEVAASRGWSGEQVELHVHDPNTGEEYRLTGGTITALNYLKYTYTDIRQSRI